ncbi:two-partner secretion domain-containing protein [Elioraea rosea]|uniref:two-partner secretion domain-containing protein n=1 Tax=Elioraea rosea TaxID=2492390 RepID=UPI001182FA1A|nr:filamentous hemagglutinin N-terminal domain-containing protein [Elioraea rosea]
MRVPRLMLLAGTALCAPAAALSQPPAPSTLPTGGAVIAGQASIATTAPNRMQVTQGSDRAVIGWQSFSIGSGASVDIRQPGAGSISVQQVQGNDPSRIFGQLSSNGRVVVANPNGIWFGPDAKVDAAGIAAAAGRMSPDAVGQFMADGQVRLDQPAAAGAAVVNEGRIAVQGGGLAALVGPTARNSGTIEARLGRVQIAGGSAATVDFDGDGLISVRAAPGAIAENTGRISADGGRVRLSVAEARGVLAGAVNMGGVIEARSVTADGGSITLGTVEAEGPTVTVTGRVDATGAGARQRGGTVSVLGDRVAVASGSRIDVSGAAGGGSVHLGGAARGASGTRAARTTRVDQGAVLAADATISGAGGSVVLWSEEATQFSGAITARGAGSGAGGFAEVSGREALSFAGTADLRAPSGQWGTLLLDPTTLTVVSSGGTSTIPGASTPGNIALNASAVVSQLGFSNVELFATSTITIAAPVAWASAGTLRLTSGGAVNVLQPVSASGSGGFVVRATGAASIGSSITLAAGALDIQGASVRIGGGAHVVAASTSGPVRVAATTGDVIISATAAGAQARVESGTGPVTVSAGQDLIVRGASTSEENTPGGWSRIQSGSGTVSLQAGGNVRLEAGTGSSGDAYAHVLAGLGMTVDTGGDVRVGLGGTTAMAQANDTRLQTSAGMQTIRAGGALLVRSGGANATSLVHSGGTQVIEANGITVTANGSEAAITARSGQALTSRGGVTLNGGSSSGSRARIATSAGEQTITATGRLALLARSGGATVTTTEGAQTIETGDVQLVAQPGATVAIEAINGDQTIRSGGAVTLTGAANGAASIEVIGGAQSVTAATTLTVRAGSGSGNAGIAAAGSGQSIEAARGITLQGAGAAAFIRARGGPQTVRTEETLTLIASPGATPLGLSETSPTGPVTAGSTTIQSMPGTAPGEAGGAANQTIAASAIALAGPPGTIAISLQDLRAVNDSLSASPRYQSVLAAGAQLAVVGSEIVLALVPPPAPPATGGTAGPAVANAPDPGTNALRLITAPGAPQLVTTSLASGTGGFTPASLGDTQGFQAASVSVDGEDPSEVFANALLAEQIEGLAPAPVPYFAGYVAPPPLR